jgi:hypothetical protein
MFVTMIFRILIALEVSRLDIKSEEYLNLLSITEPLQLMRIVDGLNTQLIFFSLFYYSSLISHTLSKITAFFIKIASEILNLTLILMFLLLTFTIVFHSFYEQKIQPLNDFANSFVSTMSLSLGNQFLNEDDVLIGEQGQVYYYLVSSGSCSS